jgi:hypothetical protein
VIKTISRLLVIVGIFILLAACSAIIPEPTATPVPTSTPSPSPTATPLPPTATTMPTPVPTLDLVTSSVPVGTPAKEWNGLPIIMPGALAGEGDASFYRFTTKATPAQIQAYYKNRLAILGWTSLASGTGETGTTLLIFMKDTMTLSVSIIPFDDLFLVMLVH